MMMMRGLLPESTRAARARRTHRYVISWYSTQPSEKRSELVPYGAPSHTSGAMYTGVPIVVRVWLALLSALATPRSPTCREEGWVSSGRAA